MMSEVSIRVFNDKDYPAIVNIDTSLNIVWPQRPQTPSGWAEIDRSRNPKRKFQRWVAVLNGDVVGFGSYGQGSIDYHPHRFHINIEVSPDHQNQGVGAALYDQIISALQPFEPRVLRADAFTHLPHGFAFLQKRGFYEAFRETPVHLDVASFDPGPFLQLETRLSGKDILIKTLQEMESDRDRDHKIYDLYWDISEDVPNEGLLSESPSFEEWVQWGLHDPAILKDAYFIVVIKDEYIALSEWGKDRDDDVLQGGLLGVRRAYRKLGIAKAMMVRGILYAQEQGYPVLKTCTAIQNLPMQRLFNTLGFARDPEWIQCQKDIL